MMLLTKTKTYTVPTAPRPMMAPSAKSRLISVSPLTQNSTSLTKTSISKLKSKTPGPLINKLAMRNDVLKMLPSIESARSGKTSIVKIKIYSNWGHPSKVGSVEIDFVDINGKTLPIKSSMFNKQRATEKMKTLWNHDFNIDDQQWIESWPPEAPHNSHKLHFSVQVHDPITGIRVWPNTSDKSINIRQVSVSIDRVKVYKGEFPKDIGVVIPITNSIPTQQILPTKNLLPPSFSPTNISIHIKSTYGNTTVIGLHQFLLVNEKGKILTINEKFKFVFNDIKPIAESSMLVREIPNDTKYELDKFEPWTGEIIGIDPTITLLSKKSHQIGAIIFIGTLLHEGTPDIHIKNIAIDFNGKRQWVGRLKHRVLDEEFEYMCATYAFFKEDKEYQQHVKSLIPERKPKDYLEQL